MSNTALSFNIATGYTTPAPPTTRRDHSSGSDVQQLKRQGYSRSSKHQNSAAVNGSSSPSPSSSGNSTPTKKLISEPFCDPIELMANRLAEELELFGLDGLSYSSDEEPYSTLQPNYRAPSSSTRSSSRRRSSSSSSPSHTRNRSGSLSVIPEED